VTAPRAGLRLSDPVRPPRSTLRDLVRIPGRALTLRRLDRLVDRAGSPIVYGNAAEVLHSGEAIYARMLEAMDAARSSISIEMYTWADDRAGRRFAAAAGAAARRGVHLRVLLDAFGSLGSGTLAARMERDGVEVRWVHPLAPWTPRWVPNQRDHRKLIVVDGRVAFAGGMNLAETYTREFAGDRAWRDMGIRFEGPAVREIARLFVTAWIRSGGSVEGTGALFATPAEAGRVGVQVVGGRGLKGRRGLRRSYLEFLSQARRRVLVVNAYFAPERVLRSMLARTARRGVAVDLLLAGESDVPAVRWAGRASYGSLLRAGVRILEHRRTVLHAKAAVFDEEILLAGSANLDYRSFRHNLEVAVHIFDGEAAREAARAFDEDLALASEVTLDAWERRPLGERILETLAASVAYWL
jgi:cardiolipin synthase